MREKATPQKADLSSLRAYLSLILLFLIYSPLTSFAGDYPISSELLSQQTLARFERVPEFEFIIREANKLGIKVYLFGGTASAFAHYVRWDLEREAGDDKYQKERFDYDFTNIYRGNQDLDLVVDGTSRQAELLKEKLEKAYPHFVGSKDAWEVRLLRESRGDKRALLGDDDFKKQHSDTNSTGIIALNPDEGGIVYNDLLNWGSHDSEFLKDVASARIKFLFGKKHNETERFTKGLNPPVLAAIRYLAKLAQYEVQGTSKDLATVTKIITETNFKSLSHYGKKKAEEFALKTLLNAPDSEYAWNLLEKTGARRKLIEMDGERLNVSETLSWWLNKEPLRSKSLGKQGETALEVFGSDEIILSHETTSFQAYDNITRSSKGGANAFISRSGVTDEMAAFGEGFYTLRGMKGAKDTGLTIRFKLHPGARKNIDFTVQGSIVVVQNKKALTLIQENLDLSMIDFLKLLQLGEIGVEDKGLKEKFLRKFGRVDTKSVEFAEAVKFVMEQFFISKKLPKSLVFKLETPVENFEDLVDLFMKKRKDYFDQIVTENMDQIPLSEFAKPNESSFIFQTISLSEAFMNKIFPQLNLSTQKKWLKIILSDDVTKTGPFLPNKAEYFDLVVALNINKISLDFFDQVNDSSFVFETHGTTAAFVFQVLPRLSEKKQQLWLDVLIRRKNPKINLIVLQFFKKEKKAFHEPYIEKIIKSKQENGDIIQYVLSQEQWFYREDWLEYVLTAKDLSHYDILHLIEGVFSKPYWIRKIDLNLIYKLEKKYEKLAPSGEQKSYFREDAFDYIFSKIELYKVQPQLLELATKFSGEAYQAYKYGKVFKKLGAQDFWSDHIDVLKKVIKETHYSEITPLITHFLSRSYWKDHSSIVDELLERNEPEIDEAILESVMKQSFWNPDDLKRWIKVFLSRDKHIIKLELAGTQAAQEHWAEHSQFIKELIARDDAHDDIGVIRYIMSSIELENEEDVLLGAFKKNSLWVDRTIVESFLSQPHSQEHKTFFDEIMARYFLSKEYKRKGKEVREKIFSEALSKQHWKDKAIEWTERLIEKNDLEIDRMLVKFVLSKDYFTDEQLQKFVSHLVDKKDNLLDVHLTGYIEFQPHWPFHKSWIEGVIKKSLVHINVNLVKQLSYKMWIQYPELIEKLLLLENSDYTDLVLEKVLSQKRWSKHPYLIERVLEQKALRVSDSIAKHIFTKPYWQVHTKLLSQFIKQESEMVRVGPDSLFLLNDGLKDLLSVYLNGQEVTRDNMLSRLRKKNDLEEFLVKHLGPQDNVTYQCESILR